ncbi:putative Major facilitator superfamily (MFS) profile domain-containing protein [Seiridium cardinale]|uniref:Major facilitator superfamily (MFS) profile domain-containing protein n=1 Tax=Seiridium cardinale TaxID=138064 RepID=A0ABR2Y1N0_9PEZI
MKSNNGLSHVGKMVPRNATAISILLVVVAVVNSATLGYDSSMMNGLSILPQYSEYFALNTATTGLNNGAVWMGSVLGATMIQPVSDILGRKKGILIAGCICVIGTIIQSAAHNIATFVVGRIFVGIGSELASGPAPTLIAEILPAKQRGPVLGLYWTCFYVGSLLSSAINLGAVNISTTWAWRLPSLLQAVPSLLSIAVLPLVPESPRWLIMKGRNDEAREIIAIMHGMNDVAAKEAVEVFDEINSVLVKEREEQPKNPWKEFFTTKANRHRLSILVSFGVMIEMLGNFVISYYLGDMLTQAGITDTTTQLQVNVILSCWSFAVAVTGSLLVDVVGRRFLALTSIGGMVAMLYIFGGLSKTYGTSDNTSAVYGTVAVVFLFQGFYAFGITPLTSMYPPEILPYNMRNAGISIFRCIDSCFGLMASFAMSYAMDNLGWKFYFINGSWNVVFLAIVYFTWVETRRMPLEEIAIKFGDLDVQDLHRDLVSEVVTDQITPSEKAA